MVQELYIFEPTNGNDYTSFNQPILNSDQTTATKPKFENKGWFNFSKDSLLPVSLFPMNMKLFLLASITKPINAHVQSFRSALYSCVGDDAVGENVVKLN